MTIGGSKVPNHGAVYLGDGRIGHHQQNRLSSIDIYGGYYQKMTSKILRFTS
jgi:cell wall-associated NlpC family hydrolase